MFIGDFNYDVKTRVARDMTGKIPTNNNVFLNFHVHIKGTWNVWLKLPIVSKRDLVKFWTWTWMNGKLLPLSEQPKRPTYRPDHVFPQIRWRHTVRFRLWRHKVLLRVKKIPPSSVICAQMSSWSQEVVFNYKGKKKFQCCHFGEDQNQDSRAQERKDFCRVNRLFCFVTESPITVTVSPTQLRVREGEEAVFQCRASGSPTPNVRWTKANQVPTV